MEAKELAFIYKQLRFSPHFPKQVLAPFWLNQYSDFTFNIIVTTYIICHWVIWCTLIQLIFLNNSPPS